MNRMPHFESKNEHFRKRVFNSPEGKSKTTVGKKISSKKHVFNRKADSQKTVSNDPPMPIFHMCAKCGAIVSNIDDHVFIEHYLTESEPNDILS